MGKYAKVIAPGLDNLGILDLTLIYTVLWYVKWGQHSRFYENGMNLIWVVQCLVYACVDNYEGD